VTTRELTGNQRTLTLPTIGAGYTFQIDWGDYDNGLTGERNIQTFVNLTAPTVSHTYLTGGLKTIRIS
jgi:hypothetical protein